MGIVLAVCGPVLQFDRDPPAIRLVPPVQNIYGNEDRGTQFPSEHSRSMYLVPRYGLRNVASKEHFERDRVGLSTQLKAQ